MKSNGTIGEARRRNLGRSEEGETTGRREDAGFWILWTFS
jgi:hypothetical protein